MVKDFKQLTELVLANRRRRRMAVVWPSDDCTRGAVALALEEGIVDAIMVGARQEVEADSRLAPLAQHISIVDAESPDDAAAKAVALVRDSAADILMKGMINTDNLLRAVLNKQSGILSPGHVLTHVTAASIPAYDKLLLLCDVAVIPYPTLDQRRAMVGYTASLARSLGVDTPRIALTHCTEKVDERHFPFTADYRTIAAEAAAGNYGPCIVDGPFDVLCACSPKGMEKKHLDSPIAGQADVIIFPDIEAGNTFYKTITLFAGASVAGMLVGADAPVVLASRGDSEQSKFYSMALAALSCN